MLYRLLTVLIGTLLLVWLVALWLVYISARHEVAGVFDAGLVRSAQTLETLLVHELEEQHALEQAIHNLSPPEDRRSALSLSLSGIQQKFHYQENSERLELAAQMQTASNGLLLVARQADGEYLLHDAPGEVPPTTAGFSDLQVDGERWRIHTRIEPVSGLMLQIGERQALREELIRSMIRDTLSPALVALPILVIAVILIIGKALAPLRRVAELLAERSPDSLDPIPEHPTSREVQSLVQALNQLLGRVRSALHREKRFTADAAHELRTPLAALKTHLEVTGNLNDCERIHASIEQALAGVDRTNRLVEQLLLLARADAAQAHDLVSKATDLRRIAMSVVGSLSQSAVERHIDLGLDAPEPVVVQGDAESLSVLLRNLVDNAVRYTPEYGHVTVSAGKSEGKCWIAVADDGLGIPAQGVEFLFERFRRGRHEQAGGAHGSGLGLSIVRRIAEIHDCRIEHGPGLNGAGFGIRVVFADANRPPTAPAGELPADR